MSSGSKVLCVDLDGTFFKVDTLHESLLKLFKEKPWQFVLAVFKVFTGKSQFKNFISSHVDLKMDLIPINEEVLDYINQNRKHYQGIYLVTGANQKIANSVVQNYSHIFKEGFGSNENVNLTGTKKGNFLKEKFGAFDYIGDSKVDFKVWEFSEKPIYCGNENSIWKSLSRNNDKSVQIKRKKKSKLSVWIKALRVHQWAKNLLVFAALILSHQYTNIELLTSSLIAFFAFSFTASSVYLLNDLLDMDVDRVHRRKKFRPIPLGDVTPFSALFTTGFLLGISGLLCSLMPYHFGLILLCYFIVTSLYSFRLKKVMMLDVVVLALLFTIRLLAGHFAIDIEVSPWILTFSMFLFTSLACIKRSTELKDKLPVKEEGTIAGRGYSKNDYHTINSIGSTSGVMAVLVMALYVNSDAVIKVYTNPYFLWGVCPLLIYWIGRLWLLNGRGLVHDDPVVFVVKDRVSLLLGIAFIGLIILAK